MYEVTNLVAAWYIRMGITVFGIETYVAEPSYFDTKTAYVNFIR